LQIWDAPACFDTNRKPDSPKSGTRKPKIDTQTSEQLLRRKVKRIRGGLVFKAYRLVYHSTLGWRVIQKNRRPESRKLIPEKWMQVVAKFQFWDVPAFFDW